jgi:hypothetical protein
MYNVGDQVQIRTRLKSNVLGVGFEETEIKGTVVPNAKWLGSNYVSVHTGNPNWPVSMILVDNIIGGKKDVSSVSGVRLFRVRSVSKNSEHLVTVKDGGVRCDCVGFGFRNTCRHAKKVEELVKSA